MRLVVVVHHVEVPVDLVGQVEVVLLKAAGLEPDQVRPLTGLAIADLANKHNCEHQIICSCKKETSTAERGKRTIIVASKHPYHKYSEWK